MSSYELYLSASLEKLKTYILGMESRPILFIGSGFSQRYIHSPTWHELLKQLIDENPKVERPMQYFIQEHSGDYPKIASELVDHYHAYAWENYKKSDMFPPFLFESESRSIHLKYKIATKLSKLVEEFDPENHILGKELELISRLNPQAIITTNYDTLLESLFPKYEAIVGQEVIRQKRSTDIGHILKIHGCVDYCKSIVIEKEDYNSFSKEQIYLIAKLFTYFMEHPIIFIGYSLTDENIKSVLYNVKQIINSEIEPVIENMWFIDWSREPIHSDELPQSEKTISVGNGESVKLNYIKLHQYEELYKALYQDSMDIEFLKRIEETVYNVVKSDTIKNLEVDIASFHKLTDRESLLKSFTSDIKNSNDEKKSMITFAHMQDANELALKFCITPSNLSSKVFGASKSHWSYAYELINTVKEEKEVDLRASNNNYHVNLNGVSRYSMKMVELLKKVRSKVPYDIDIES